MTGVLPDVARAGAGRFLRLGVASAFFADRPVIGSAVGRRLHEGVLVGNGNGNVFPFARRFLMVNHVERTKLPRRSKRRFPFRYEFRAEAPCAFPFVANFSIGLYEICPITNCTMRDMICQVCRRERVTRTVLSGLMIRARASIRFNQ